MDWNVRPPPIIGLPTTNFQMQGPTVSQQFTTACNYSQTHSPTQNPCTYSRNDQTIIIHSSARNIAADQLPLQNSRGSNPLQPILPKASIPSKNFVLTQPSVRLHPVLPVQLSNVTVQMPAGMVQNSWPNCNVPVFPPVVSQSRAGHPVQNPHEQPHNQHRTSEKYVNGPQKQSLNSTSTSAFIQDSKNSSSKRLPPSMPYYHVNRPAASQACTTVPLNHVPSHCFSSQQNSSSLSFPSGQNIPNPINCPDSNSSLSLQSQPYASNSVIPPSYTAPINYDSRDAAHLIPQVTNINPPPPYTTHMVQMNNNINSPSQSAPSVSNVTVQNHQTIALDQSVSHSFPHCQNQSLVATREASEKSSTEYRASEHVAEKQPPNDSADSPVENLVSFCNSIKIAGTVSPDKTSTPVLTRTLVQGENGMNNSEKCPDHSKLMSKTKIKITKDSLALDYQKLRAVHTVFSNLRAAYKLKRQLYVSSASAPSPESSVHDQAPNLSSLPSCNTSETQPLPLSQNSNPAFQPLLYETSQNQPSLLPHDITQHQSLSLASYNSHQGEAVSFPRQTERHLVPILKELLKDTNDGEMKCYVANAEKNQNGHLTAKNNILSNSLLVSSGDIFEKSVNTDRISRPSPKTSPIIPSQESFTCTKTSRDFEQTSKSAKEKLERMPVNSDGDLVYRFGLHRDAVGISANEILTNLQNTSSAQNSSASNRASLLGELLVKGGRSALIQQSDNTFLQTLERNITNSSNGNVSDTFSSANLLSKTAAVPEMSRVQTTSVTENSCTMGKMCTLEELETSLALWKKNPPTPLHEQLSESTDLAMNLSSSTDGMVIEENVLNASTQIKVKSEAKETTSLLSSAVQKVDSVNSGSLKGSEPQIAIVPPLILSKENIGIEVEEKNPSAFWKAIHPVIEKELVSISNSCITDSKVNTEMLQKAIQSTGGNGIMNAVTGTNCSYGVNEKRTGQPFLELKKIKTQQRPEDNSVPGKNTDCLSSKKDIKSTKTEAGLLEQGDTATVVMNDSLLQISSVCTLVQGDAFYNSQIASIFSASPLESHVKNDTASEDRISYDELKSGLGESKSDMSMNALEREVLLLPQDTGSKAIKEQLLENVPHSDRTQNGKVTGEKTQISEETSMSGEKLEQALSHANVHKTDLTTDSQALSGNQGGTFCTVSKDNVCANKESIQEQVPSEEHPARSGGDVEASVTLPNDQLSELSKEFPYGIGDLTALKQVEVSIATNTLPHRDGQENQTHVQYPELSNAINQIKIILLNSQQREEYFPEHKESSSKLETIGNDQHILEDENNFKSANTNHSLSAQAVHAEKYAQAEPRRVKKAKHTYCCLQGWLASKYAVSPCSCMSKDAVVNTDPVDVLKSKTMSKESSNPSDNCKTNRVSHQLHSVSNIQSLRNENNKNVNKNFVAKETAFEINEFKPCEINQEAFLLPSLAKLDPQKPKRKREQEVDKLPLHMASQSFKSESVPIKETQGQKCTKDFSTETRISQASCHSTTEDLEVVALRPPSKKGSSEKAREIRERMVVKSNTGRRRSAEMKPSKRHERFKIKRDSSETHMIKGPLRKTLQRPIAKERKHKILQRRQNSSDITSSGLPSPTHANFHPNSTFHSQQHVNRPKWEKSNGALEKNGGAKRAEHNESSSLEHAQLNKGSIKRINLEKYAYSIERKNAWKYKRSLSESETSKLLKQSSGKEALLDVPSRDKCSEKTPEKKPSLSRFSNKLHTSLQRDQKKNYLQHCLFKRTAQERIRLTKLEHSPSKSLWYVKSSSVLGPTESQKTSILPAQQSKEEKPQMLEFKMCPEILFGKSMSEEQILDKKKIPEKEATSVTGTV